jgi:hypothetical protein
LLYNIKGKYHSESSYIGMLEGFKKRKERRDLSFPPLCGDLTTITTEALRSLRKHE